MTGPIDPATLRLALPALLGTIDDAAFAAIGPHLPTEWASLGSGRVLFAEGEASDALYLVISGRLRATVGDRAVGAIGRGESVGEMGVFTGEPRRATVTAVRDTVLVRISGDAFTAILTASPALALNLNRVVIDRLTRRNAADARPDRRVTNVAVVAVTPGLPTGPTAARLVAAVRAVDAGPVLHLTRAAVDAAAGRSGAADAADDDPAGHRWLVEHLDRAEAEYRLVVYEVDPTPTAWTRRCLRAADEVVLFVDAAAAPTVSPAEAELLDGDHATAAHRTLVLLHPPGTAWPTGTAAFLDARPAVGRHLHLRPDTDPRGPADAARLARFLTGRAVGLVLAGGGARGLAHIGVFRGLDEASIPVDAVGGTSIGSIMAACRAVDWTWQRVHDENRGPFLSNPTRDFNLPPLVSLLSGRRLARILARSPLAGRTIEDLWLPFYCVSANYTRAAEHVHRRGDVAAAVTASMAIPGVFPPVVHEGTDLLVDGGLFNNLPVDVMAAMAGIGTVLAVDLRPPEQAPGRYPFTTVPPTRTLIRDRLRRRHRRQIHLPSMLSTLMTTAFLASADKGRAAAAAADLLFHPDVSAFGLLDWHRFDDLVATGYRHAQTVLAADRPASLR